MSAPTLSDGEERAGDRLAAACRDSLKDLGDSCWCEQTFTCEPCRMRSALALWDAGAPLREAEREVVRLAIELHASTKSCDLEDEVACKKLDEEAFDLDMAMGDAVHKLLAARRKP